MAESLQSRSLTTPPWKLGGLSVSGLASRLWDEAQHDEILGRSAQLAYYFLLALFPALLFLTALIGLLPIQSVMPEIMSYLRSMLPGDALSLVEKYLQQVVQGSGGDIVSFGLLGALWASSSGVTAIMDSLNAVYNAKETRPLWQVRLVAMAMTLGLAGFIIISITLVLYGGQIGAWMAHWMGMGRLFTFTWVILQWPVVLALMLFAVAVIYYFSPDVQQEWRWITPGSLFAVIMWVIVSLGFKLYVENVGNYNAAYGSIAGVIVLMLWFYLSGAVLLLGGRDQC